ncbi:MAG: hypothetical protein RLN62_02570 [Rickettsiales bacterium]
MIIPIAMFFVYPFLTYKKEKIKYWNDKQKNLSYGFKSLAEQKSYFKVINLLLGKSRFLNKFLKTMSVVLDDTYLNNGVVGWCLLTDRNRGIRYSEYSTNFRYKD